MLTGSDIGSNNWPKVVVAVIVVVVVVVVYMLNLKSLCHAEMCASRKYPYLPGMVSGNFKGIGVSMWRISPQGKEIHEKIVNETQSWQVQIFIHHRVKIIIIRDKSTPMDDSFCKKSFSIGRSFFCLILLLRESKVRLSFFWQVSFLKVWLPAWSILASGQGVDFTII